MSNRYSRRRMIGKGIAAAAAGLALRASALAQDTVQQQFTFIVAGLDHRDCFEEHNSDVLMLSRVDLGAMTVRTISIPRDLYVDIPTVGRDKITRAFHYGYYTNDRSWQGGADLLRTTLENAFGMTFDGVVSTEFAGFRQIIDRLGGIEVVNPYEITPPPPAPPQPEVEEATPAIVCIPGSIEHYGPVVWSWPEGEQVLEPNSALNFVRARHMDGDPGRVMRQHIMLRAILDVLQQPGMVRQLPGLVRDLRDAVDIDIPLPTQARLLTALPTLDPADVNFATLSHFLWGGYLDNGMWVYQGDWSLLPGVVRDYLDGQRDF